jgi:hypothetical protein
LSYPHHYSLRKFTDRKGLTARLGCFTRNELRCLLNDSVGGVVARANAATRRAMEKESSKQKKERERAAAAAAKKGVAAALCVGDATSNGDVVVLTRDAFYARIVCT